MNIKLSFRLLLLPQKEIIFIKDIYQFITKILKLLGPELLSEIKKSLYESQNTEKGSHYNGVVRKYSDKLKELQGQELKKPLENGNENDCQESYHNGLVALKAIFDAVVAGLLEEDQGLFEEEKIVKIFGLLEATVLHNQKMVCFSKYFTVLINFILKI